MIRTTWLGGLAVTILGLILGFTCLALMLAFGGHYVTSASGSGYDFVPDFGSSFWIPLWAMIAGFMVALGGVVVQVAAWVGALIRTYALPDRTWFAVLLAGGVIGLVFPIAALGAMIAYLISGVDRDVAGQSQMPAPGVPRVV